MTDSMTKYEINKEQLPMIDSFENARNHILRDMWNKAHKWKLSEKQVAFALKLWKDEQIPVVKLSHEKAEFLRHAANVYLPDNYYNSTGAYIEGLISTEMEQFQYDKVIATFHKYRKSIFNKVFK